MTDSATGEKFVYVIYIRTTPEKLWEALTKPEFTRQYWAETWQDTTWQPGADWKLMIPDGRVGDSGEIVEIDPPRRMVLRWRNEFIPEMKAEGDSRCVLELEPQGDTVKLTVAHSMEKAGTKFLQSVSNGWPSLLSSLKSLLETGTPIEATTKWPKDK
jgi:uncharacterized protein YndB with AHSA1/START domain